MLLMRCCSSISLLSNLLIFFLLLFCLHFLPIYAMLLLLLNVMAVVWLCCLLMHDTFPINIGRHHNNISYLFRVFFFESSEICKKNFSTIESPFWCNCGTTLVVFLNLGRVGMMGCSKCWTEKNLEKC